MSQHLVPRQGHPYIWGVQTFKSAATRARDQRREEVATSLLAAIERLLREGVPFAEISVDRLSHAAGLHRSSFYRYYADKGELLQDLARGVDATRSEKGLAIWALPGDAPRSAFDDAMLAFISGVWEHRVLMGAVADATGYDAILREQHDEAVRQGIAFVSEHISTAQQAGYVRPGLDADIVAAWVVYMTDRGLTTIVGPAAEEELPEVASALGDLLWNTLYDGIRDPAGRS